MDLQRPAGGRESRRRLPRLLCGLALCGLALFSVHAGATGKGRGPATTRFACDGGITFEVSYVRGGAWVTTAGGRWLLRQGRSSIGRRYSSPSATFILDDDRAALVGLPGGPFRRCLAAAHGAALPRAGRQI